MFDPVYVDTRTGNKANRLKWLQTEISYWDPVYFSNVLKWGYDPTGRTPYKHIKQEPCEFIKRCELAPVSNYHLAPEEFRAVINRSILGAARRTTNVLVSGGLDSSIIYYTLQDRGYEPTAYSFENGESEFLPEGTIMLPGIDEQEWEKTALRIMEEPLDMGSLILQTVISKRLQNMGVDCIISGDGADELFGGYRRAKQYDSQASDIFCELTYYHIPRLVKMPVEYITPYLSYDVFRAAYTLPRTQRTEKQALKKTFKGIVPDRILEREKQPLKSSQVIEGGLEYRKHLINIFKELFGGKN